MKSLSREQSECYRRILEESIEDYGKAEKSMLHRIVDSKKLLEKYSEGEVVPTYSSYSKIVKEKYDSIAIARKAVGKESPTKNIKHANNFLKMFSIRTLPKHSKVLDLGCGRGQSVEFLRYIKPSFVLFYDLSPLSLLICEKRWRKQKIAYPAAFVEGNFCSSPFFPHRKYFFHSVEYKKETGFSTQKTSTMNVSPFCRLDVVVCHLATHYSFCDRKSTKQFIKNIAQSLKVGGIFLGSAVHGEVVVPLLKNTSKNKPYTTPYISMWLNDRNPDSHDHLDENHVYKENGQHYTFSMKDTCTIEQYTLLMKDFIDICQEYSLAPVWIKNFRSLYSEQIHANEKMSKLCNVRGDLSEGELHALSMYCMFKFVKK